MNPNVGFTNPSLIYWPNELYQSGLALQNHTRKRHNANNGKVCRSCGSGNTPLWRKGPDGPQVSISLIGSSRVTGGFDYARPLNHTHLQVYVYDSIVGKVTEPFVIGGDSSPSSIIYSYFEHLYTFVIVWTLTRWLSYPSTVGSHISTHTHICMDVCDPVVEILSRPPVVWTVYIFVIILTVIYS